MVVVSHDLRTLEKMSDRVLWLDHGQVRHLGAPVETIWRYEVYMKELAGKKVA